MTPFTCVIIILAKVITTSFVRGGFFYTFLSEVVSVAAKLTAKQQRFVQEYLVDFNATQAATRAGYSAKTAQVIGAENLTKPMVAAEIQRLGAKTAAKLELSREWVLERLQTIADANITDFVSIATEPASRLVIHPLTGEPVSIPGGYQQTVRITDTDKMPTGKAAAISSIKQGANGIEIKLHDSLKAVELLGKVVGLFDNREAPTTAENNLFDAIKESAREELPTDDIQEIEQEATACADVVEPSSL